MINENIEYAKAVALSLVACVIVWGWVVIKWRGDGDKSRDVPYRKVIPIFLAVFAMLAALLYWKMHT